MKDTIIDLLTTLFVSTLILGFSSYSCYAQGLLPPDPIETPLKHIIERLQQKDWGSAKRLNQQLSEQYPNFKLPILISDMINQQQPLLDIEPSLHTPEQDEYSRENLLAELTLRHRYQPPNAQFASQSSIITLATHIKHAVLVDVYASRLYLLKNEAGKLSTIADYFIGIGKQGIPKSARGDHRTPIGVYTITEYIPDHQLPELYGIGAFPIDYPNTWDRRLNRTGSGIWIHGVPRSTYNRGPRSSRGCVTISNDLFNHIKAYIAIKQTPVVIIDKVNWSDGHNQREIESEILLALQQWKQDWQSLNTDTYLQHYHSDYRYQGGGLTQWANDKHRVNRHKTFINVDITNLSIFNYLPEQNLILVKYTQSYRSDRFHSTHEKEQYWKKKDGRWKIISERVVK